MATKIYRVCKHYYTNCMSISQTALVLLIFKVHIYFIITLYIYVWVMRPVQRSSIEGVGAKKCKMLKYQKSWYCLSLPYRVIHNEVYELNILSQIKYLKDWCAIYEVMLTKSVSFHSYLLMSIVLFLSHKAKMVEFNYFRKSSKFHFLFFIYLLGFSLISIDSDILS